MNTLRPSLARLIHITSTMSSKKLLTIFGATGNQGGSVIDAVLERPELQQKYNLRGISRDPASGKSKALSDKGIEMVKADLDDIESLKKAVKGSHGVFGVTDFWSIMDKNKEIQQGKNLFEACKAEGVTHYVFSSLNSAEKMSGGKYKNVDHFDSKADVGDYMEDNKGDMITSHFMPAMFIEGTANVNVQNGTPTLAFPFPNEDIDWPLLAPRRDSGKYVMGLFEGGSKANGIRAQGVSEWTTPKKVVAALSKASGQDVAFYPIPADTFLGIMTKVRGEQAGKELTEMFQLIGEYNYYGKNTKDKQSESDRWLLPDAKPISYEQWAKESGPKEFK